MRLKKYRKNVREYVGVAITFYSFILDITNLIFRPATRCTESDLLCLLSQMPECDPYILNIYESNHLTNSSDVLPFLHLKHDRSNLK
jgi:hypothetical protein